MFSDKSLNFVCMILTQCAMRLFSLSAVSLLVSVACQAQRGGVVIHMETGVPMRGVFVTTNSGERVTTDYLGKFLLAKPFKSLTFTHSGFVPLSLERSQMSDTIALMPQFNTLEEVVVWGRGRHVEDKAVEMPSYIKGFKGPSGHDFLSIFKKRVGLNSKQRKKHQWIIENY